jgi:hypothetical protein
MKTEQQKIEIYSAVKNAIPRPRSVEKIPDSLDAQWLTSPDFSGTFMTKMDRFLTQLVKGIHHATPDQKYTGVHNILKTSAQDSPKIEREIRHIIELPPQIASLMLNTVDVIDRVYYGHELSLDNLGSPNNETPITLLSPYTS